MLIALFKLSRPINVLIGALSVLIAATLSVNFQFSPAVIFAMISSAFITAAANIINDIFDIEIDRINRPQRALVSGEISIKSATISYHIFNILGVAIAFFAGKILFIIAILAVLLLYFYSRFFKRTILLGNIVVSFITGLAFIYGAAAVDDWKVGLVPGIFAFLFHLGREIIKDMQDMQGDLAQKAITFPGRFGKSPSILLINLIFMLLIFFLIIPFIINLYSIYYMYVVIPGVSLVLLFISILLWFKNDVFWLGKISMLLKIDMFIGLIAIYIGTHNDFFLNY